MRSALKGAGTQIDVSDAREDIAHLSAAMASYGGHVGFPASLRAEYLSRVIGAGYVVVDVRETGRVEPRCAERSVVALWLPAERKTTSVAEAGK